MGPIPPHNPTFRQFLLGVLGMIAIVAVSLFVLAPGMIFLGAWAKVWVDTWPWP